jgi:hypothetical protein
VPCDAALAADAGLLSNTRVLSAPSLVIISDPPPLRARTGALVASLPLSTSPLLLSPSSVVARFSLIRIFRV